MVQIRQRVKSRVGTDEFEICTIIENSEQAGHKTCYAETVTVSKDNLYEVKTKEFRKAEAMIPNIELANKLSEF